ncbi:DUF262 domain-containing protein [Kocuria palustris]|uniref:DUF262 domain-containing protein n=1 Tax=Kocuria palustris TaxID=71999 RepID=UPI00230038FA|nr:DUF262 domain-containing protein [Kocuria palustris]
MSFETPQFQLAEYVEWAREGKLQLPDFQREYKWDDERVRQLIVTVLRGHPMGIVMLLQTGNEQVRFKPKAISGSGAPQGVIPDWLLLDGQQRLTSLTQAFSGDGTVATRDSRGKLLDRRYFVDVGVAIEGDDRLDDAVLSLPADGIERSNFGRDIVRDVSDAEKQIAAGIVPVSLFLEPFAMMDLLAELDDRQIGRLFMNEVVRPTSAYRIPAISLDRKTSKAAVATVFEKVNTGGVPLTVFELLTSSFAGDAQYFEKHGSDFRLKDDWTDIAEEFARYPVLADTRATDFIQGISLLETLRRNRESTAQRPPAVSAKREDLLKLELCSYLAWRDQLRDGFLWAARFMVDQCIFDTRFLPYSTQLVPLAVIRVLLGAKADSHGVQARLRRWFWCGVLGEQYGSASETRFVRDVEQVPAWAGGEKQELPVTVAEASFNEWRLYTLSSRVSAAYKGIYALQVAKGAADWIANHRFDLQTHKDLATDIHHVFPRAWAVSHDIKSSQYDSIINKTPLAARTNRAIGGVAPSQYLRRVERESQLSSTEVDELLRTHGLDADAMRQDDFVRHFEHRREFLVGLIEEAMGTPVQRESSGTDVVHAAAEAAASFDPAQVQDDTEDA